MTPPQVKPPVTTLGTLKPPQQNAPTNARKFAVSNASTRAAFKLGVYGPEGIGKSSLMAVCPGLAAVADIEQSQMDMQTPKVVGVESWSDLRAWVQSLEGRQIVGIDSITRAEDWAAAHVIDSKKSNEGLKATDSLEDFKYGAGVTFVCDEFRKLLGDIDGAVRRGVSFVIVAHARINRFKNPDGSDFLRYEPRLIDTAKGSNMLQFVQFLDHLAFIDLDKSIDKGKVKGSGSRTIYLDTSPARISKCRGIPSDPIAFDEGSTALWDIVLPTINSK